MKKLLLLFIPFLFISCNDDDDTTDFNKHAINVWVTKSQSNIYEPVFEINDNNSGLYYSKDMINHGDGNFETIYYKNEILSYKYTKNFGFEFKIADAHKPPYYYIESITKDSAVFIINRYTSQKDNKIKLYTKSYLDSMGFIEIQRNYL